jgi:hypothetical protein
MRDIPEMSNGAQAIANAEKALSGIREMRQRLDDALKENADQRPGAVVSGFVPAVTALIEGSANCGSRSRR